MYNGLSLPADIYFTALLPLTTGSSYPGDYKPAKVYFMEKDKLDLSK
jgi:hypothetical protein